MLNNFIGGGQVFLHKVRMFSQVFYRTLHVALIVGCIVSIAFYWSKLEVLDWDAVISYRKAALAEGFDDAMSGIRHSIGNNGESITYITAQSQGRVWQNIEPVKVLYMPVFRRVNEQAWSLFVVISITAVFIAMACFILIFMVWSRFGRGLREEKRKEGSGRVLTPVEVRSKLKSLGKASDIHIGKMPLVQDMETQHILTTGSTGSGKTNLIHNILPQVKKRKQPAVVVDQTGEMIAKYYNPERGDIIFNPFDERSYMWDFFADCRDNESIERFAQVLMSFNRRSSGTRSDPFWDKSAQEIFESTCRYQRDHENYSIEELNTLVRDSSLKFLSSKLKGTAAARYLEMANSVTASSILSVLTTSSKPISYLRDNSTNGMFSLRQYFADVKSGKNAWLFLATKPSSRQLTLPLIACLTELALTELMDTGIDQSRRVWFVLDELAALGNLPALSPLMTEGRKYGACVLAGLQSLNQLYEYYGVHAGSKIFGQFGTLCFFRNQEESICRMITAMCGKEVITRHQKNTSFGANSYRDGVSYNEQENRKDLVTQNDLASLARGQCYVLLPEPEVRLSKMQTPEAKLSNTHKGFIQSKDFGSWQNSSERVLISETDVQEKKPGHQQGLAEYIDEETQKRSNIQSDVISEDNENVGAVRKQQVEPEMV